MVSASKRAGLGRTLNRAQKYANERRNPRKSQKHTTNPDPNKDNARLDLKSVTAQTNLDEFFEEANLAGKQFITERRNVALLNETGKVDLYSAHEKADALPEIDEADLSSYLSVPRRPKWDENTTPEQLAELEKLTFLNWRRKLARLQENDSVTLTPFEKNLEVWRQLWRVIERSDIIVQILDCRNPLLYVCDDLIKYVKDEFGDKKLNIMLLNKADYLTLEQRKMWAVYFKERGIKVIFFSALYENQNSMQSREESDVVASQLEENLNLSESTSDDLDTRLYDKFELLDLWKDLLNSLNIPSEPGKSSPDMDKPQTEAGSTNDYPVHIPTVGLVGYPNVGKSSTINALLSAKRVAVSATPGKTKHFQTFLIDKNMMLCDCPGLVFANFVSCKSEMVINGILPIDQMKDYVTPVKMIVARIPRAFFEVIYGLAFEQGAKQNITADDLLNAFGFMRGYMTPRGLPDTSRAARVICKDYINGKILFCQAPPNVDKKVYYNHSKLANAMKRIEEMRANAAALRITERQRRLMAQAKGDHMKFKPSSDSKLPQVPHFEARIKGLPGIGDMTQPIGEYVETRVTKHGKKHKKREKLRRVYRELDV